MQGVCCTCQCVVPVSRSTVALYAEINRLDLDHEDPFIADYIRDDYGDSIDYLCDPHDAFGQPCDGAGQIPQAIIKETVGETSDIFSGYGDFDKTVK